MNEYYNPDGTPKAVDEVVRDNAVERDYLDLLDDYDHFEMYVDDPDTSFTWDDFDNYDESDKSDIPDDVRNLIERYKQYELSRKG